MTKPIKIVPEALDAMTAAFKTSMDELQDTISQVNTLASKMEDGALVGNAGTAFSNALRASLVKKLQEMHDKFDELAHDLQDTKNTMTDIDQKTHIS